MTIRSSGYFRFPILPLLGVAALTLSACGPGNYLGSGNLHERADTPANQIRNEMVKNAPGPITTAPVVGRSKVPAGTTPIGATGYATANSARTNGTIVNGQAARCSTANDMSRYSDGCAHAAGLPAASQPYTSPYKN